MGNEAANGDARAMSLEALDARVGVVEADNDRLRGDFGALREKVGQDWGDIAGELIRQGGVQGRMQQLLEAVATHVGVDPAAVGRDEPAPTPLARRVLELEEARRRRGSFSDESAPVIVQVHNQQQPAARQPSDPPDRRASLRPRMPQNAREWVAIVTVIASAAGAAYTAWAQATGHGP